MSRSALISLAHRRAGHVSFLLRHSHSYSPETEAEMRTVFVSPWFQERAGLTWMSLCKITLHTSFLSLNESSCLVMRIP